MQVPVVDSSEIPRPPEDVRFRQVRVEPYPDGTRVRLRIHATPYLQRPDLSIEIAGAEGGLLAASTVIENAETDLALTLHLRAQPTDGSPLARLTLTYPDRDPVDTAEVTFSLPGWHAPSGA
jgi:hypothetical protein